MPLVRLFSINFYLDRSALRVASHFKAISEAKLPIIFSMVSMDSQNLITAQKALKKFSQGLATGVWEEFLQMLTEDFSFWFPVGPYRGTNIGKEKAREFFYYVSQEIFPQGISIAIQRVTSNEDTVVFEVKSTGEIFGKPYENLAAISFDIQGDRVTAYREYLSVIFSR